MNDKYLCEFCNRDLSNLNAHNVNKHKEKCEKLNVKKKNSTPSIVNFMSKNVGTVNLRSVISIDSTSGESSTDESSGQENDYMLDGNNDLNEELSSKLNNAHLSSRQSRSKRKRVDVERCNQSDATTIIEATVIENNNGKTFKCLGYKIPLEDIYINFPFQTFAYNDHDFVFENGNFHSKKCCENNYSLLENLNTTKINTSCLSLKYCMNFDKIIKRSENYNKYNNNEYLTYFINCKIYQKIFK